MSGYSELPTDEQAWQRFRGQLKPAEPLRLGAYCGGYLSDFLWTAFPPLVCVSQRVVELLRDSDVSGWSLYPVEVFGRRREPLPGYHGFSVIGPECARDRSRSQVVDKRPPAPGGRGYQVYRGLYFYEKEWDGSDFFRVRDTATVVTEKVYRLFKRAKVTNVLLVPLPEVEIDVKLDDYEK